MLDFFLCVSLGEELQTASVSDIHHVKETSVVHNNGHSTLTAGSLSFYSHGFIVIYHAFFYMKVLQLLHQFNSLFKR